MEWLEPKWIWLEPKWNQTNMSLGLSKTWFQTIACLFCFSCPPKQRILVEHCMQAPHIFLHDFERNIMDSHALHAANSDALDLLHKVFAGVTPPKNWV